MKRIALSLTFLWMSIWTLSAQWEQVSNFTVPDNIINMDLDGNTMYAAAGTGFYKSTNGGISWTKLGLNESFLYQPVIEGSGSTVVVHSRNWDDPLRYSTNGGTSFELGGTPPGSVSNLIVDGNKVFVLCDGGLLVSTDQGATLTNTNVVPSGYNSGQIVKSPIGHIAVGTTYDANTYEYLTSWAYLSTDGVNWTDISGFSGSNPLPNTPYSVNYIIGGYTNGTILVGMTNWDNTGALYGSTDMGANWSPFAVDLFPDYVGVMATTNNKVFINTNIGNYASSDLVNWTNYSNQLYSVYDAVGTTWVGTNLAGKITVSTNDGVTWQATSGQINGNDIVTKYTSQGNATFVGTMYNGLYKKTTNGWNKVLGNDVNNGGNYIWDVLQKGNTVLAVTDWWSGGQAGIFRSTNNGQTWSMPYQGFSSVLYDDGNAIYAGTESGILKSSNSGQTWTEMNNGLSDVWYERYPSAFGRIGNKLLAGFLYDGIYISTDNGASWTQKWEGPQFNFNDSQINCFVKVGSDILAATDYGILLSTDQGENWEYVQNDVLNVPVTRMVVGPDDVLYIGTGTQGMYSSTDGGETLVPHNDGAGENNFVSALARDGGKLYAGWNNYDPTYGFYYFGTPAAWGRLLWSETPENLTAPDDRNLASSASEKLGLEIFPNPVQDVLRYKTNVEPAQIAGVAVINTRGEIVRDLKTPDNRSELDVHDLPAGTYFFRMTMQDGKQMARQFILLGKR